ncbi:MAG: recombinase family protein [Acidimicrobiales bacterium]
MKIEHDLESAGLTLLAADEGISNLRKRATAILTRRVKQATSEWYVLDTLEKAWDGFCEHASQGWNIGVAPYGFVGERIPHPVPAKRAEGLTKTRLVLDPVRAPVVQEMFAWRTGERLSWQAIADRLNADPDRYPPPTAIGGTRSRGSWSALSVRAILGNPKYTGYMVWNRRSRNARFGSYNPPDLWVWSAEPTHPAIVTLDVFRAADAVAFTRRGSRSAGGPNAHPATKRTYVLRSFVYCAICRRRMEGTTRKGSFVYFRCRPRPTDGHDPFEHWPEHPKDMYVAQDKLLAGILSFYAKRVFGRHRRDLLAVDLGQAESDQHTAWEDHVNAFERTIADLAVRRQRLLHTLEVTDDPDGVLAQDVNRRLVELSHEHDLKRAEVRELQSTPVPTGNHSTELLDHLGQVSSSQLEAAPEPSLRRLFDATALSVHYDPRDQLALCSITVDEDSLPSIDHATTTVASPASDESELGMLCACALGGIRTPNLLIRSPARPLFRGLPSTTATHRFDVLSRAYTAGGVTAGRPCRPPLTGYAEAMVLTAVLTAGSSTTQLGPCGRCDARLLATALTMRSATSAAALTCPGIRWRAAKSPYSAKPRSRRMSSASPRSETVMAPPSWCRA